MAAAQEERFTREKQDPTFPKNAMAVLFKTFAGMSRSESFTNMSYFMKSHLPKFERLLETDLSFAPRGFGLAFAKAMPFMDKRQAISKVYSDKGVKD